MMMMFLLRGASTAKHSQQGLSRAEPNSQERARAPPEAGVHSRARGRCALAGTAKKGIPVAIHSCGHSQDTQDGLMAGHSMQR